MTTAGGTHDVIGIGIGPFNLGLAALLDAVPGVDAVFFDAKPAFSWHAGLLLEGTTLQVPFLADLVTLADPTNPHSFLNYLHHHDRLLRFYFYEHFHVPRREYDAYCRWVAGRLDSCRFGQRVVCASPLADGTWSVVTVSADGTRREHRAASVVMGIGSCPIVPAVAEPHLGRSVFHTAQYLDRRHDALGASSITVIGSGQSAGEVMTDLLERQGDHRYRLDWFTRARGFFPMEYSKLGLEHFSPEYISYFHGLRPDRRDEIRAGQDLLYKGLSASTSERIYDLLYERSIAGAEVPVDYVSGCDLRNLECTPDQRWRLQFRHLDQERDVEHVTDVVVLGTGYRPANLPLAGATPEADAHGRPTVDSHYRVHLAERPDARLYVQNAELHTHGVGAPDLGLGAHRNAVIVNALAGEVVYPVTERGVFQRFGTGSLA